MNPQVAFSYAKRGWPVFPAYEIGSNGACSCNHPQCTSPGKHPRTLRGFKDASIDEQAICQFWQCHPTANLGIVTGALSGIVVLDVDPKNNGFDSLEDIQRRFGSLPLTPTVITGSQGLHYYFRHPGFKIKNATGVWPGIDFRGDGGYVIAPPSNHVSGNSYRWKAALTPDELGLSDMPSWLIERLINPRSHQGNFIAEITQVPEGSRNSFLFKIGASLRGHGHAYEQIFAELKEQNGHSCKPPLDLSEVEKIARNVSQYSTGKTSNSSQSWSVRCPLPSKLPSVPSMTEDYLPEALRPWIKDATYRMQNGLDMMAVSAVVALSGLVGRRCGIMPKMNDDWTVIPNLWGGIVAPPSAMKTPALKEALAPIYKLEKAYLETFANDSKILESQAMVTEIRIKSAEKRLKEAVEQHEESTIQALQGEITALKAQVAAEKPVLKRLIANDATIEKLTELLNQNPKGMLVFRDELYGFLMSMEKEGHEMYRSFFLESWNGSGSYVTDRIGRGTIATPALCLAILGGIQPDRLNAYFSSVMKGGSGDDGFLSRLQLMVYPDLPKEWELIDQKPDQIARNRAYRVFQRVSELDFIGHGFEAGPDVPIARFNGDAQEFYYNWLKELELRLRSETIESAAFESHLGKYRSLMPSLALLFHLIKFADGDTDSPHIDLEAAKLSVKWCAYLEGHAKRIYSGIIQPEIQSAHAIAKKIQIGKVTDGMTVRDLYRKQWTSLSDQKTVEAGLGLLENLNWLKIMEASPTGLGARSEVIRLHPDFLGEAPNAH